MGKSVRVICDKCEIDKTLNIGGSFFSIDPKFVENNLDKKDLVEWNLLRDKEVIKRFIWEYELAFCKQCKELGTAFKVNIQIKDGTELYLGCKCDKCGELKKIININKETKCPLCKNQYLKIHNVGHWD